MTADPLTLGAVAFVAMAALLLVGWGIRGVLTRRPKTREEAMSEDARIADRLIAESIEEESHE